MTIYNVISILNYNYISASILGLCFYEPLPNQTSGVPTSWALVVIPLSLAPEILFESQIWIEYQIFKSSTYIIYDWINLWLLHFIIFHQYLIFRIFMGILVNEPTTSNGSGNQLIAWANTRYLLQTQVPGLEFGTWHNPACAAFRTYQSIDSCICLGYPVRWYVANVSIISDAPCLFYTNCFVFCLHFVAFLCIFWN
jgi:hypothetical protein